MIETARLILRPWRDEDLEPFARLNADPRVMEYYPRLRTSAESDSEIKFMSEHIVGYGWGFWVASLKETGEFIGFIGLEHVDFQAPFTPAVEIGWRLAFDYWGKGYATEGALACLRYGFEKLQLEEIVSFTAIDNKRSRAVMERIGMNHDPKDDFGHPKLPENHPLRRHVLYRLNKQEWLSKQKYVYKPYNKIFPDLFQKEKARISSSLTNAFAIEHIGSTAVPNLGGKGIIDIGIAVSKEEMQRSCTILQQLGYEFRPSYSTADRFYFVAYLPDPEEGSRRYHVHLTYPSNQEWKEFIGFRDYLRDHPATMEEYANIKKQAANTANRDGKQYRKMKEAIIQKILCRVLHRREDG